ncbi:MAG TPA: YncE family protein [Bryobacteraceae bacterium]|nr:YncE family protein [Bryobacteraceae bacterium]
MISGPVLAVSRTEANKITLLALDNPEREIATIAVTGKQPFGLAFDRTRQRLYAACWTSAEILGIALSSLRKETSVPAPRLPAWATRREGADEIWISNEGAGVVSILDTHTGKISDQIATGRGPSDIAFTADGRYAWVTNEKDGNISLIDAGARRKIHDIRVGEVPQGIAVLNGGNRLLVANFGSDSLSVVDTTELKELTQIVVGRGPVDVVALGPEGSARAWVTCFSEGTVAVIDLREQRRTQRIEIGGKPQGIETDPTGDRVYVCVRELNQIAVLNTEAPSAVLRRISMKGGPARMAVAL